MPDPREFTYKADVETGRFSLIPPPDAEVYSQEWKESILLTALAVREGGELTITFDELAALRNKTLHVYHDYYNDTLIIRVR